MLNYVKLFANIFANNVLMTKNKWQFYLLRGVSQGGEVYWKVGTSGPISGGIRHLPPLRLRGRMNYGAAVDQSLTSSSIKPANRVYRPWRASRPISYDAPRLGIKTVADPIDWKCIFANATVRRKELDQIIAAFADDAGKLIANRGRLLEKTSGRKYRGAIEIIDGSIDIVGHLSNMANKPFSNKERSLAARDKADVKKLIKALKRVGL